MLDVINEKGATDHPKALNAPDAMMPSLKGLKFGEILEMACLGYSILKTAQLAAQETGAGDRSVWRASFLLTQSRGNRAEACCITSLSLDYDGDVPTSLSDPASHDSLKARYRKLGWGDDLKMSSCEQCKNYEDES